MYDDVAEAALPRRERLAAQRSRARTTLSWEIAPAEEVEALRVGSLSSRLHRPHRQPILLGSDTAT
jgi:hypothetical protein